MTTQHTNPNWPGSTYNGFAGPAPAMRPQDRTPVTPRRLSQPWMLGGIAAAVAAGVALGFAAQPKAVSAAKVEASATPMAIELAAPRPAPPIRSAGKLDVRPVVETAAVSAPTIPRPIPRQAPVLIDPEPAPPPMIERAPRERAAPPPELYLDGPADVPDEPGYYDEADEPGYPG